MTKGTKLGYMMNSVYSKCPQLASYLCESVELPLVDTHSYKPGVQSRTPHTELQNQYQDPPSCFL